MHRVVIVGCGFAGLVAAKTLRGAPVEVVVVGSGGTRLVSTSSLRSTSGRQP
jgi:NADH dehydrogenase FAD-containing subunit